MMTFFNTICIFSLPAMKFAASSCFLVLLHLAFITINEATQKVNWGTCPPGQPTSSYKIQCANLTFPLNYNKPSMGNVTAFVRRQYVNKATQSGIWLVAGGPGDSTYDLAGPLCDYFIGSNNTFTCYTQDARGTGLSSYMSCGKNQPTGSFDPYNASIVAKFSNCFNKIKSNYGSVLQYYSTYNAMKDLLGGIQAINPSLVHFYVQSFGTYAMNTYMQLPGARADVIVFDGPVPPNRWPFEDNAEWSSQVAQDVVYTCASNSSVCSTRMSVMAHIPKLVMDSIIDGTLPCLRNITWLRATDGQFWAAIYNNYCTCGGNSRATTHLCIAPFWYRLHRCSATDITQLNFFRAYQNGIQSYPVNWLSYSLGVGVNIGISELYSFSKNPMSYSQQVQRSSRMFATSGVEMLMAYARNVTNLPTYKVNSSVYMKFFKPKVPVLILVGTLDANTENGLGYWYQQGLGSMATLLNVPYNCHITVSYDAPCVDNIVLQFFETLGKTYDSSCLAQYQQPDWDGSTQTSRNYSYTIFGTHDLWNDNYTVDVSTTSTTSTSCPTTSCSSCSCQCTNYNITAIVCGITIPLVVIIIALVVVNIMLYRQRKAESVSASTPAKVVMEVEMQSPASSNNVDTKNVQFTESPLAK